MQTRRGRSLMDAQLPSPTATRVRGCAIQSLEALQDVKAGGARRCRMDARGGSYAVNVFHKSSLLPSLLNVCYGHRWPVLSTPSPRPPRAPGPQGSTRRRMTPGAANPQITLHSIISRSALRSHTICTPNVQFRPVISSRTENHSPQISPFIGFLCNFT
jgi:hypothetical protein